MRNNLQVKENLFRFMSLKNYRCLTNNTQSPRCHKISNVPTKDLDVNKCTTNVQLLSRWEGIEWALLELTDA